MIKILLSAYSEFGFKISRIYLLNDSSKQCKEISNVEKINMELTIKSRSNYLN